MLSALARLDAVPEAPEIRGSSCAIEGDIAAARVHELRLELPGLTRGEGVLECEFGRYEPVNGAGSDAACGSDWNPLDRAAIPRFSTVATVLFDPDVHESLVEDTWIADRARAAIREIVEDTEDAFDDGWPTHPRDFLHEDDETRHYRAFYCGGAGVVRALDTLQRRGLVELRRDYVSYLDRPYEPDVPDDDSGRLEPHGRRDGNPARVAPARAVERERRPPRRADR